MIKRYANLWLLYFRYDCEVLCCHLGMFLFVALLIIASLSFLVFLKPKMWCLDWIYVQMYCQLASALFDTCFYCTSFSSGILQRSRCMTSRCFQFLPFFPVFGYSVISFVCHILSVHQNRTLSWCILFLPLVAFTLILPWIINYYIISSYLLYLQFLLNWPFWACSKQRNFKVACDWNSCFCSSSSCLLNVQCQSTEDVIWYFHASMLFNISATVDFSVLCRILLCIRVMIIYGVS